MNAKWFMGLVWGLVSAVLVALAWRIAGAIGALFGLLIVGAIALRFAQYIELLMLPSVAKNFVTLTIVFGLTGILATWGFNTRTKQLEEQTSPRATERIVILTIPPGGEITYDIPPRYWFRIYSREKVEATTWDGRKIKNVAWLGDEIRDANFVLKSDEKEKDAKVIITLRPK